jgi:hypothetical protein
MFRSLALSASKSSSRATSVALRINPAVVRTRGYHEKVISHYENPRNVRSACFPTRGVRTLLPTILQVGSLPKNDVDVGTGLVGAPA